MQITRLDLIEGLTWYWDQKNAARDDFEALTPENFLAKGRQCYGKYFMYLLSAIDIVQDYDSRFSARLKQMLERYGGDGNNNYMYLRQIRHLVVHRGEDLVGQGTNINGQISPVCPPVLREKKGQAFKRFTPYLNVLLVLCECKIGPEIERFLDEIGALDIAALGEDAKRRSTELVDEIEHCPRLLKDAMKRELAKLTSHPAPWGTSVADIRAKLRARSDSDENIDGMLSGAASHWKSLLDQVAEQDRRAAVG